MKGKRTLMVEGFEIVIQPRTRKDMLGLIDEFIENLNDGYNMEDFTYEIVYKNGDIEVISQDDYDGHKIKRQNIKSILENNPEDYQVFGEYEYNDFGIVHAI